MCVCVCAVRVRSVCAVCVCMYVCILVLNISFRMYVMWGSKNLKFSWLALGPFSFFSLVFDVKKDTTFFDNIGKTS